MARLFGRTYTREELLSRVTRVEQLGGVRRVTLASGLEAGTEALELRTGTGLCCTLAASRALDLATAEWQGRSLGWRGGAGVAHPSFFDPSGLNWLRTYFGGLLTTCGLTWFGAPHQDPDSGNAEGPSLGLHGRISHLPAEQVNCGGQWEGDDYVMWVEGTVREWMLSGPHLELRRRWWARLGENRLHLRDVVTNCAYVEQEHMILYHFNPGFPLLDEGARFVFPSRRVLPRTPFAQSCVDQWDRVGAPQPGPEPEAVYYHTVAADQSGRTVAALVNRATDPAQPLGLALRYDPRVLPVLAQWKNPRAGSYVTGLEPCTNRLDGRPAERAAGRMIVLEPGESRTYEIEVEVLTTEAELAALELEVAELTGGAPAEIAPEPATS